MTSVQPEAGITPPGTVRPNPPGRWAVLAAACLIGVLVVLTGGVDPSRTVPPADPSSVPEDGRVGLMPQFVDRIGSVAHPDDPGQVRAWIEDSATGESWIFVGVVSPLSPTEPLVTRIGRAFPDERLTDWTEAGLHVSRGDRRRLVEVSPVAAALPPPAPDR